MNSRPHGRLSPHQCVFQSNPDVEDVCSQKNRLIDALPKAGKGIDRLLAKQLDGPMDMIFQALLLFLEYNPGEMRSCPGDGPVVRIGRHACGHGNPGQDEYWNNCSEMKHCTLPAHVPYLTQRGPGVSHATESGTYYY